MTACFNVKRANAVNLVKGVYQNDIKLEIFVVKNANVQKKGLKFTIVE
jgi:hypothetical protein